MRVNGAEVSAECRNGDWWLDGRRAPGVAVRTGGRVSAFSGGHTVHFTLPIRSPGWPRPGQRRADVLAPMPGLVKAVFVAARRGGGGGRPLAILEAMKMEHTLTAAREAQWPRCWPRQAQQVEAGAALIGLEEAAMIRLHHVPQIAQLSHPVAAGRDGPAFRGGRARLRQVAARARISALTPPAGCRRWKSTGGRSLKAARSRNTSASARGGSWQGSADAERPDWLEWLHFAETIAAHVALTQQHVVLRETRCAAPR